MRIGTRNYSFTKSRRLLGRHAIVGVYAFRCWVSGEWFQVYAKPSGRAGARFAVVVSKRVVGSAVARNFCKRLAREVFRTHYVELAGVDFVARTRRRVTPAGAAFARREFRELLYRAARRCRQRDNPSSA